MSVTESGEQLSVVRRSWRLDSAAIRALLVAFILAMPAQLLLAWSIAYFCSPSSHGETSRVVSAPPGSTSNVGRVRIENNSQFGIRWVTITAWSGAYQAQTFRSDEEPLFDEEPTWPFPVTRVFPALRDTSRWPRSAPPTPGFLAGTLGHTPCAAFAIGWPFLSAVGYSEQDYSRNSGVILLREPTFRRLTYLGTVPLCYIPRWQGLLGNTLVYGTLIFTLWALLKRVRARLRSQQRRCHHCRYDLHATPTNLPCPECGKLTAG